MLMRAGVGGLLCIILSINLPLRAEGIFIPTPPARQIYNGNCNQRLSPITTLLSRINILKSFSSFSIGYLPDEAGFIFSPQIPDAPVNIPVMRPMESKSIWRIDHWKTSQTQVNFLDMGLKNLEPDMDEINRLATIQMANAPHTPFEIDISYKRAKERVLLQIMRWRLHDVVLTKYQEMKKYLTSRDFAMLDWTSGWSDNSDLFAIVNGDPLTPEKMTLQALEKKIALTIQITYFGRKDFERPTLQGALDANLLRKYSVEDELPFEFRLGPAMRKEFAERVYTRFDRATTCEFMRYAKVDKDLPRDIHDRFLLEALLTAKMRGMKTILASGDSFTSRLFRRYGFEIFDRLPTNQVGEIEYLSYLDTDSPAFAAVIQMLNASSRDVETMR
jgi:hypothetical protein